MLKWALVFFVLTAAAQRIIDHACPRVEVLSDFDLDKVRGGPWGEIRKFALKSYRQFFSISVCGLKLAGTNEKPTRLAVIVSHSAM